MAIHSAAKGKLIAVMGDEVVLTLTSLSAVSIY